MDLSAIKKHLPAIRGLGGRKGGEIKEYYGKIHFVRSQRRGVTPIQHQLSFTWSTGPQINLCLTTSRSSGKKQHLGLAPQMPSKCKHAARAWARPIPRQSTSTAPGFDPLGDRTRLLHPSTSTTCISGKNSRDSNGRIKMGSTMLKALCCE